MGVMSLKDVEIPATGQSFDATSPKDIITTMIVVGLGFVALVVVGLGATDVGETLYSEATNAAGVDDSDANGVPSLQL